MFWRKEIESLTEETPFIAYSELPLGLYTKSNFSLIIRNNRIYAVLTSDDIGKELQVEFKEQVILQTSFFKKPLEYMKVLALLQENLRNLLLIDPKNSYNQNISFSIPFTRLNENTFKILSLPSPKYALTGSSFLSHPLNLYYNPIVFNMASSKSIKDSDNFGMDKPLLYIGKRKDLALTKFTFVDSENNSLTPTNTETRTYYVDTEFVLMYFDETPFTVRYIA